MARKKVNGKPPAINVLSEARQDLYYLQESCHGLEAAHDNLEMALGSTNESIDGLASVVESLDDTMQKCLAFAETWESKMDDWEDRLGALEGKAEAD